MLGSAEIGVLELSLKFILISIISLFIDGLLCAAVRNKRSPVHYHFPFNVVRRTRVVHYRPCVISDNFGARISPVARHSHSVSPMLVHLKEQ